jgi:phosphatidate cytidylyltransferase
VIKQRLVTALVLGILVLAGVFWLPVESFSALTALVVLLGASEWARFASLDGKSRWVFVAVVAVLMLALHLIGLNRVMPVLLSLTGVFWLWACLLILGYPASRGYRMRVNRVLIGLAVLVPTWVALSGLKGLYQGEQALLMLLLLVWGADTGAYCAGKLFGRHKMIPRVSPGKTLEGLAGGVVTCLFIGIGFGLWLELPAPSLVYLTGLALLTCLAAVFGDLFESLFKRERGLKDSGTLLPGHGGILDRIDSLTAAAPVFMLGLYWLPVT